MSKSNSMQVLHSCQVMLSNGMSSHVITPNAERDHWKTKIKFGEDCRGMGLKIDGMQVKGIRTLDGVGNVIDQWDGECGGEWEEQMLEKGERVVGVYGKRFKSYYCGMLINFGFITMATD